MASTLSIRQRLLLSHLFSVVVLAGAFGAFVYYAAAQQIVERMNAQLAVSAVALARSLDSKALDTAAHDDPARQALAARLRDITQSSDDIAVIYVTQLHSDGEHVLVSSDDAAARDAIAAESSDDGRLIVHAVVPGEGGFRVSVETRANRVSQHLYILRLSAVLAFLACVLAALVLSRHLARLFQHSITDLAARCRALANGEPLPPRRAGPSDEFDGLAREFDSMAGRLKAAAEGRERASVALREANEHLESRVRDRTAQLEGATTKLKQEIESRVHVEALLGEAALTDALTGLLNRRAMMEMLGQASMSLKPNEAGLSVILADIDHFKRVNDLYGHTAGDEVLVAIAALMRDSSSDQLQYNAARWGGEEFLILLPGTRLAAACKRAEQIRRAIAGARIGAEELSISVSLGVAELVAGDQLDDCLRRCDQALYRAKDAGRNAVVAAQGQLFATMS
jgi:diguanylate cyclase (GGDEF)-like protein